MPAQPENGRLSWHHNCPSLHPPLHCSQTGAVARDRRAIPEPQVHPKPVARGTAAPLESLQLGHLLQSARSTANIFFRCTAGFLLCPWRSAETSPIELALCSSAPSPGCRRFWTLSRVRAARFNLFQFSNTCRARILPLGPCKN